MRSLVGRQYAYLATLGVHVHDERVWHVALDTRWRHQLYYPRKPVRYHTTQDRVWLDGVAAKQRDIRRGFVPPYVTVTSAGEVGASDLWICNGHHTLAAYLDLGRTPYIRWFERASVSSGYCVRVPRFDPTATR
jgi:hypothetical protein